MFFSLLAILLDFRLKIWYDNRTIVGYFRKKGARIGDDCFIFVRWLGDEPYLVDIGNHVYLAKGVLLHTSGSNWMIEKEDPGVKIYGRIMIEDNCFIGINTQIMPNVKIGQNSVIGAGSVVIADIPPNCIAMGVPARVVGSTLKYKENLVSDWNRQKPPGWPFKNQKEKEQMLRKYIRDV
jgi:acetyltransferase-like isoleucine patch superfamily enzyme